MNWRYFWFAILLAPAIVSCDVRGFAEKLIPEAESEFAKSHFMLYQNGEVDQIISQLSPLLIDDKIRLKIQEVVDYIPNGAPVGFEIVGSNTVSTSDSRIAHLTFQYEYPDQWLVFSISVDASTTPFTVRAINAQTFEQSLGEINAFRLTQNGIEGLLFVVFGIAVPIFCISVFVICLRTPIPKGKWRWAIFTLLGAMTFQINWTTGQSEFNPMHIQLLGAGFVRSGFYGPWVLSVAIPFGALIFLAKRRKWLVKLDESET